MWRLAEERLLAPWLWLAVVGLLQTACESDPSSTQCGPSTPGSAIPGFEHRPEDECGKCTYIDRGNTDVHCSSSSADPVGECCYTYPDDSVCCTPQDELNCPVGPLSSWEWSKCQLVANCSDGLACLDDDARKFEGDTSSACIPPRAGCGWVE